MLKLVREMLERALPEMRDHAAILLDREGRVAAWLWGAEAIFGYSESEALGRPSSFLFVPEDVQSGMDRSELEIAARGGRSEDDRWHLRKDGQRIWASGTVNALRGPGGVEGYVKMARDRTDARIGAQARANQLAECQSALGRAATTLQTLGHEMRNPLAPIKNSASLLPRLCPDPRAAKLAEAIARQVGILERIASDLMDATRVERGGLELRMSSFDARELLAEEVGVRAACAREKGVEIEALVPGGPLPTRADADRLRQALGNLLGNAVKYTPAGGRVWAKATMEGGELALRIQDTGIGIDPETLPRIFELFTQEPRAKEHAPGGLGIGLAVVSQIAAAHGGVAEARSAGRGRGSEFTLRIPAAGAEP